MFPTSSYIHPTAQLNVGFRKFQGGKSSDGAFAPKSTTIGENVHVGANAILSTGVVLGDGCVIDHQCIIEPDAVLEEDVLLIYRAIIGAEARIGARSVIGGFIAERCQIEQNCRIFGQIVHRQSDSTQSWDEHDVPERSAIVRHSSFIGFGAIIAGGVEIGPNAYVCAGSIVTRNVPPEHIASGVNVIVKATEWKGQLAANPMFQKPDRER